MAKPLDPNAEVLNSFMFRPAQTPYKESARSNGSAAFSAPAVDATATATPDQAKELLDGAKPTVRILYNSGDPDRVKEYALIAAAATKAGFVVSDAGKSADQWLAS